MHISDRYVLALAMLDGDRAARKVLADMLEEQGERGLAQWARQGRRDKRRTLEFAVALLSCRPRIALAAEFMRISNNSRLGAAGDRLLRVVQHWGSRGIDSEVALDVCRRTAAAWLAELGNPYVRVDYAHERLTTTGADWLVDAVRLAVESEQLAALGEYRRAAARRLESGQYVRQIVRRAGGFPPLMAADGSIRYVSTVEWQIERVQRLFQEILASEEDLWPK